ncbi:MAG TPA: hypothetical protein PK659_10585 [Methanothrix sp.]|nr:hypothetical protein [Methanothrix sp.]HOK59233.1 hypothetical protein [Methanothrix sp.]HOL44689.1 hypothetical protein [Methanothrix sp.]HPO89468.1 hypothetical protein [Methanothrix sp.]
MVRFTDLDWREILNDWSEDEIEYLMAICGEKLEQIRTALPRAAGEAGRSESFCCETEQRFERRGGVW